MVTVVRVAVHNVKVHSHVQRPCDILKSMYFLLYKYENMSYCVIVYACKGGENN